MDAVLSVAVTVLDSCDFVACLSVTVADGDAFAVAAQFAAVPHVLLDALVAVGGVVGIVVELSKKQQ